MRDRFSTAIYCDFCGKGLNECTDMIGAPLAHICDRCVEAAMLIVGDRRVAREAGAVPEVTPAALTVAMKIDFEEEAKKLKRVLSDHHAYPAAGGGAGIDNGALPLIEGTLRMIAMLSVKFSRQQNEKSDG